MQILALFFRREADGQDRLDGRQRLVRIAELGHVQQIYRCHPGKRTIRPRARIRAAIPRNHQILAIVSERSLPVSWRKLVFYGMERLPGSPEAVDVAMIE